MIKLSKAAVLVAALAWAALGRAQSPGADTYKANCVMCHGEAGDASTPAGKRFKAASFMSPEVVKKSDADLFTIAKSGKGDMPPWSDSLTDKELQEVIAYIRTLQKKE